MPTAPADSRPLDPPPHRPRRHRWHRRWWRPVLPATWSAWSAMRPVPGRRAARTSRRLVAVAFWATLVGLLAAAVVVALAPGAFAGGMLLAAVAASSGGIGQVTAFAARLTDYVTAVAASVAVLFIAINGVRWTTSGGNPSRQAEAKAGLAAAVVGLALAVSANLIVNLVLAALK